MREYERAAQKYSLSLAQESRLADLYDHAALSCRNTSTAANYILLAEAIQRRIIRAEPANPKAWRGLGKLAEMKGNVAGAAKYYRRAFREIQKRPKSLRGALGIGHFYEQRGDLNKGEAWYKREFHAVKDLGSAANLFLFYDRTAQFRKGKRLVLLIQKFMKIEFRKAQYQGLQITQNKFFRHLRSKLKEYRTMGAGGPPLSSSGRS